MPLSDSYIRVEKLIELNEAIEKMAKHIYPVDDAQLFVMQDGIWLDREDWEKQSKISYDLVAFQVFLNGHNAINKGDGHIVILSNGNIQIDADFMVPDRLQVITDIARTIVNGLYNNNERG